MSAFDVALQVMMGVSLAACAGLRTWLPLLCVGLLARTGHMPLNASFAFLERTDLLVIFGVATVLELLGDKIVVVDHFLDAVGTVARPVAGTLLAASVVTHSDPVLATVLGLIVGGGTAFTIHAGKAAVRAQSTTAAPLHGGTANMALSIGEDAVSVGGVALAVWLPLLAFLLTLAALAFSVYLVRQAVKHGARLFQLLKGDTAQPKTPAGTGV
jgi:hypothetical protein